MSNGRLAVGVGLTLCLAAGAPLAAQPQPSQHASVSQVVNTTTIRVEYDRPLLRGRSLFGDILDYDAVWTPGANRATWVDFSAPVFVEGRPVPAGRYGVWVIPHESAPWEVILVTQWDTHHSFFPSESELLRVEIPPEASPPTETLTFDFPEVEPYATTLRFHWDEVALPIHILVAH
jgi:hypothetical protein